MTHSKRTSPHEIRSASGATFVGVASDETVDGHGSIIEQRGLQLDRFKRNPVVLSSHEHGEVPVARAENIWLEGPPWRTMIRFRFGSNAKAQVVKDAVVEKLLSALSIGFLPREDRAPSASEREAGARSVITKSELLEVSIVAIPSNPAALIQRQTALEALALRAARVGAEGLARECRTLVRRASRSKVGGFHSKRLSDGV